MANAAGRGIINGGDVGANGVSTGDPTVNICANGRVTMSDGSQLVADTLRAENSAGNPCVFWDVFANRLLQRFEPRVRELRARSGDDAGRHPAAVPVDHV